MSMEEIVGKSISEWMKGTGPESDVVISSRVRLARNLVDVPFPEVASAEHLAAVLEQVRRVVNDDHSLGDLEYVPLGGLDALARGILVERHVISPQQADDVEHKAVVMRADDAISVMVNEEDHLRIQAMFPGLDLKNAWQLCSSVDDVFERHLKYAFAEKLGYLTSCPTNVGTGMRASVMVHLPALSIANQINRLVGAVSQFGLAVRGLYGEGTQVLGNIYQLSNQVTLGHSEEEIIDHLAGVARQIIDQERGARQRIMAGDRARLDDRVHRSLGVLREARLLTTHEAMQLLSDVRLGIDTGLIGGLDAAILQELMVLSRPAHLQKLMGRRLEAPERDACRAQLIRERIQRRSEG